MSQRLVSAKTRRLGMFVFFGISGLSLSTWVTRTPDVRDLVGASTDQMGFILFGLSIGSMVGILGPARLVPCLGTKPIIAAGMSAMVASLVIIGIGASLGSGVLVAAGLVLFGLGMGSGEIALNVEGAAVEQAIGRPTLPAIHGAFSVATVIGAVVGIVCNAVQVPVLLHCVLMTVLTAMLLLWAINTVSQGTGKEDRVTVTRRAGVAGALFRDRSLLLIGVVILGGAFAEGSGNDWLPLVLVDGHGFTPTVGSLGFAAFAAAMAVGRLGAGLVLERFGRIAVVRTSMVIGIIGLGLVIFVEQPVVVIVAVFLWGLGASVAFPLAISAAAESGPGAATRVSVAATIGYLAFLVGPPFLGILGEHLGLRLAMLAVACFMVLAFLASPSIGWGQSRDEEQRTRPGV